MAFDAGLFEGALDSFGAASTLFGNSVASGTAADASRLSANASRISAAGFTDEAQAYDVAKGISLQNLNLSTASTAITRSQTQREIFKVIGGARADIAGAGLEAHGSALDVIRSSQQQGALQLQLVDTQGQISEKGFEQQAAAYAAQSKAALGASAAAEATAQAAESTARGLDAASSSSKVGGIIKTVGGIAKVISGITKLFCWVAREVYGEDDPRWKLFRCWLRMMAPNWLFRIYSEYGEEFAAFIHARYFWKVCVRFAMERAIAGKLFRTDRYNREVLIEQWKWECDNNA